MDTFSHQIIDHETWARIYSFQNNGEIEMLCLVEADVFIINYYCGVRRYGQQMHNLVNMRPKPYDHHTRHMHKN